MRCSRHVRLQASDQTMAMRRVRSAAEEDFNEHRFKASYELLLNMFRYRKTSVSVEPMEPLSFSVQRVLVVQ